MTNSYYTQQAQNIFPIFGVSSLEEAKEFVPTEKHSTIIETSENVFMNISTGSVGFESDWDDLSEVVKVKFDADEECWVEA